MRYKQDKDDFYTVSATEPYCLPLVAASHAGAIEAILGYGHEMTYFETSPGLYEIKAFPAEHPKEVEKRVKLRLYNSREADNELERCDACGGPKALSGFKWHPERGVILDKLSGRRMAFMGPNQVEPVFHELEKELGDEIPHIIVEAQRRSVKTGLYTAEDIGDKGKFRDWLALRGLGNLREFKMGSQGLSMRLDNATMHLLVTGILQGVFDTAYDVDSNVEWKLTEGDNLEVEVQPCG